MSKSSLRLLIIACPIFIVLVVGYGLWQTSKSPPELMAVAIYPSFPAYLPVIVKSQPE